MKVKLFFLFIILNQVCLAQLETNNIKKIELSDSWVFRKIGETKWLYAEVPGVVHTDLFINKIIENIYFRDNESKIEWIENEDWEYKIDFFVSEELNKHKNAEIVFEGLDTYAEIYLNDSMVAKTNNMFRTWKYDIKKNLKEGKNELRILFLSPAKMSEKLYSQLDYELPEGNRVVTRKAAYHFGWDWNGRFLTSGIYRKVFLRFWEDALLEDIFIKTKIIKDNNAILNARIGINSTTEKFATLVVSYENKILAKKDLFLIKSLNEYDLDFEILNPKLWWANGYGMQWLYDLKFELYIEDELSDSENINYGIRKCEVIQEKDSSGESFYFRINDVPVFIKGANYIPQDNFLPNVNKEKYETLIKNVKDANINMLRVWGGGIYEEDYFYDLCDKNGILVWQDFMFACAMYPGDDEFLDNVRQEAIDNVVRLRNHPSIVLWCGNNEISEGWHNWGWQNKYNQEQKETIWNDYEKIFHQILPLVVSEFDSGKFYWPSSPKYGRGNPLSQFEGDSHYWGIWHDEEPFELFNSKVGRFMSEYGFQSFPSKSTVDSFATRNDLFLFSNVLKSHQKHSRGFQIIENYKNRYYFISDNINDYVYVSQILQAEGIKTAIEAHRRAKPYCMGTLYWQLNDCWPVISWSSLDYYQNWKALHYFVKKLYQPVILSTVIAQDEIAIYAISDLLKDFQSKLNITLMDFSGNKLFEKDTIVLIKANISEIVIFSRIPDSLSNLDKNSTMLRVQLFSKDGVVYEDFKYFDLVKNLKLKKPILNIDFLQSDEGYEMSIVSNTLVKNMYLYFEDERVKFSDNFFDIMPNCKKNISIRTNLTAEELQKKLRIISFNWILPDLN
ncbi:MAG: glycoside hydrolase family 2 protein [Ignavibacteriales bacterium]|nr:glycoside hydrolase family 2 protein [Ignavibacteriales bacterium]